MANKTDVLWGIGIFFVIVGVLGIFFGLFNFVGAGERGIVTDFGKPAYIVGEGISFKVPVAQGLVIMNVKTQLYTVTATASSKDLQDVTTDIGLNYRLIADKVLDTYRDVGTIDTVQATLIAPAVQESTKACTARYNAEELINQRETVRNCISDLLNGKLSNRGIIIEQVSITNFKFSADYEAAIEAKQVKQQNAQAALNDLQRIQIEAEQKIAQAQGEANATLTNAQAEAESLKIQNDALKQSNEVIMLRMIEKWDGHVPYIMSTSGNGAQGLNLMLLLNQTN